MRFVLRFIVPSVQAVNIGARIIRPPPGVVKACGQVLSPFDPQ
jgi:hypothetical protein